MPSKSPATSEAPVIGPWVAERDIPLFRRHYANGTEAARVYSLHGGKFAWCIWGASAVSHASESGVAGSPQLAKDAADLALATSK